MAQHETLTPQAPLIPKQHSFELELQRLLACYQFATENDRQLVWSVLNKYVPKIL